MAVDSAYGSSYTTQASSSRNFATSSKSHAGYKPVLTTKTINPHVLEAEYAVRGEISNPRQQVRRPDREGQSDLPFSSVVTANIGNPQQQPYLAQKPLTFWRQVAALTEYPELMDQPGVDKMFPRTRRSAPSCCSKTLAVWVPTRTPRVLRSSVTCR